MPLFMKAEDKALMKRMEEDRLIEESPYAIEIHQDMSLYFWYVVEPSKVRIRSSHNGSPYDYLKMACKHRRSEALRDAREWLLKKLEQERKDND